MWSQETGEVALQCDSQTVGEGACLTYTMEHGQDQVNLAHELWPSRNPQ